MCPVRVLRHCLQPKYQSRVQAFHHIPDIQQSRLRSFFCCVTLFQGNRCDWSCLLHVLMPKVWADRSAMDLDNISDVEWDTSKDSYPEEEEYEQREFRRKCKKYRRHSTRKRFRLAKNFKVEDLPNEYQFISVYNVICSMFKLSVKVEVPKTSKDRPRFGPDGEDYPFYNPNGRIHRGKLGSGIVLDVKMPDLVGEDGRRKPKLGTIYLQTAKHVVFDDFEAAVSKITFDDDKSITAKRVRWSCIEQDRSVVEIETDDMALLKKLRRYLFQKAMLARDLRSSPNLNFDQPPHNLAVMVSHPHGCRKRVSIGNWYKTCICGSGSNLYRCHYNTASCEGSSGAPVWLMGIPAGDEDFFMCWHSQANQGGPREQPRTFQANQCGPRQQPRTFQANQGGPRQQPRTFR